MKGPSSLCPAKMLRELTRPIYWRLISKSKTERMSNLNNIQALSLFREQHQMSLNRCGRITLPTQVTARRLTHPMRMI